MKYYLLKYDDNYADEFDISGFRVYDEPGYDSFKERVKSAKYPQERYFGTNEFVEFDSAKDYLKRIDISEISEIEAKVLMKLFSYGDYAQYGEFLEPDAREDYDD